MHQASQQTIHPISRNSILQMSAEHKSTAYSPMEIDAITARLFIKEHILSLGVCLLP